ncbi:hypothetical protein GALMADRAFT_143196 [Galerina marginata CBS 339.88]|uniref:Uncharacterized protein n=1 Tax=Galerina marginata (strain CBS 339.88) TaxID=685588 RepID=A0A067SXD9_GALM3|nr:hypothetical protein GALMADRAFT_143196 [Galerina marginata CBS 339.88]
MLAAKNGRISTFTFPTQHLPETHEALKRWELTTDRWLAEKGVSTNSEGSHRAPFPTSLLIGRARLRHCWVTDWRRRNHQFVRIQFVEAERERITSLDGVHLRSTSSQVQHRIISQPVDMWININTATSWFRRSIGQLLTSPTEQIGDNLAR